MTDVQTFDHEGYPVEDGEFVKRTDYDALFAKYVAEKSLREQAQRLNIEGRKGWQSAIELLRQCANNDPPNARHLAGWYVDQFKHTGRATMPASSEGAGKK